MAGLAPLRRRARRFVLALRARVEPGEVEALSAYLTPAQVRLFSTMQSADQRHSLEVFGRLLREGHRDPDLLQAALLHDVGKARARLRVWHRVLVDLGQTFWPSAPRWLAAHGPAALRWPLEVGLRHPELGAEDARSAGCSDRAVALIRGDHGADLARLAAVLWRADTEA